MARLVLVAFLLTFICARVLVFLIMARTIPDIYVHMRGTHIHHLNFGIFLLSGLGGYLVFQQPSSRGREVAAVLYGIGMGLTFDEFGMWIHLGGSYWQRASWDAVTVLAATFALMAVAPSLWRFRPHHWLTGVTLGCAIAVFFMMLHRSFTYAGDVLGPKTRALESTAPR